MTGPNLHQLFGRKIGAKADFNYSAALKNADREWTPARFEQGNGYWAEITAGRD